MIAFITCNSNLVPLLEGLCSSNPCSSNPCRFEFSIFGVFAGNLNARARSKIGKIRRDYAAKNIAFAPAILSVAGKIQNFYVSCGCWLTCIRSSTAISLGTKRTSVMSVSSKVGLAHSAMIGMRLALPLHTLQSYALICRYMAPLTP